MSRSSSTLDKLSELIAWSPISSLLEPLHTAGKGEPAWPPLAVFRALLLTLWYDLSDVKLAEALEDRGSFRRFCGFSNSEPTPERSAFERFRRLLIAHGLDRVLFEKVGLPRLRGRLVGLGGYWILARSWAVCCS